ncbi:unnamed protein product [[Actinomadura] parvosata subsp. kistnae]|uniref:Uncharacterized protein n=1 Tax=[Actinomadura] parvosata subsp. kistnae TaxID=1909395 RepID=A0A1V0A226_9ACTN|nr:hypothetical protein [Nonomuraea sp. ATCC 55076]AQZ64271.1 hypothetical protein BKM31_24935 [Nonomuraea sp. ATCC 55076]SPM00118.1 unnamed protein product [Actinomadura parvosata subsp. kistnae]
MRTPPHLPARTRREHTDHVRRHPYGPHDVPAQTAPRGTLDFPGPLTGTAPPLEETVYTEQRLLGIRELSNQAIGSIDDLLQHTA